MQSPLMQSPLIYIASPYSHPDHVVRLFRIERSLEMERFLLDRHFAVYSPLGAARRDILDEAAHRLHGLTMLRHCDAMIVLTLEGWRESVGVKGELDPAIDLGIPAFAVDPEFNNVIPNDGFWAIVRDSAEARCAEKHGG